MWDSTWEKIFSSRPWGKYPGEDVVRFVARGFYKFTDRSSIKLLEIGCGTGANLWFIAREGFQVYGVDGSQSAIDLSRARLDGDVAGWQGRLAVGDVLSLDFPDDYFDGVLDVEAVCCNDFNQSKLIYAEMVRVIKPGGKFYSRCFSKGTIGDETGEVLGRNTYLPTVGPMAHTGLTRFTAREDLTELLPLNLTVLEVDQVVRGVPLGNPILEWCVTAEKNHN